MCARLAWRDSVEAGIGARWPSFPRISWPPSWPRCGPPWAALFSSGCDPPPDGGRRPAQWA
eukprot:3124243-Prymnesium_polylepis.1